METGQPSQVTSIGPQRAWLWERPDLALIEAAADGELALARLRLGVSTMLLALLGLELQTHGASASFAVALVAVGAALFHSGWILGVAGRRGGRRWLGFASSLGDVTLVSLCLVGLALSGNASVSLTRSGVFPLYFLIIASTALRYDARLCVATVGASVAQYGAFLAWTESRFDGGLATVIAPVPRSPLSLELTNLVLMLGAGAVALYLIGRARRFCMLSTRDPLTGLLNRRFFDERLAEESERARRGRSRFALAVVDIDRFKSANDVGGHAGGDAALRTVAEAMLRSFRATDTVARYGGDEFALLLPEASGTDVRRRFESAAAAVAEPARPGSASA
jgi:GGDEF domain-containing protein